MKKKAGRSLVGKASLAFLKRRTLFTVLLISLTAVLFLLFIYFNKNIPGSAPLNVEEKEVLIIMYHAVMEDASRTGKYVTTPQSLKKDLEYLKENGYTTVSIKQLYAYTSAGAALPDKSVVLSFDDGYYSFYAYVFPLLKEFQMKAVLSVIAIESEKASATEEDQKPAYSHVKFSQINEMLSCGNVEIGNHTYDLHSNSSRSGIMPRFGEDFTSYSASVGGDIEKAQRLLMEKCGYTPYIFAYPFGSYCNEAGALVNSLGFIASFSCEEGFNRLSPGDELTLLKRFNRDGNLTSEEFFGTLYRDREDPFFK